MNGLAGPVAVVTGASAGIGRATVRELARRRARLGRVARGREGLEAAAADVERLGGRALVLPADVADDEALEDAAARTESAFGPLDAWINNAMVSVFSPIRQVTAIGRFDDRALERSLQVWVATHREPGLMALGVAALAGLTTGLVFARRRG